MKLSARLEAIFQMVPYGVTADIGSDHGKLMIALFENGRIPSGYAVENKEGPYKRLVKALSDAHLEEDIVPLFSDGISELPHKVTNVVLAGIGGETIIKILSAHVDKLKNVQNIIVDAHTSIPKLRKYISELGFVIVDEKIIKEDGIFYEIIKFNRSDLAYYSNEDLEFGPILRQEKSQIFKEKYQERINEIDHLLQNKNIPENKIIVLNDERARISQVIQ